MDITEKIIAARESKKIKQSELAEKLGLDRSNYSRIEKRGNKLTLEQIEKISDALGLDLTELITWGEESQSDKNLKKLTDNSINSLQRELSDTTLYISTLNNFLNSNVELKKLIDIEFKKIYEEREKDRKLSPWYSDDMPPLPSSLDEEIQHRINANRTLLDWCKRLVDMTTK